MKNPQMGQETINWFLLPKRTNPALRWIGRETIGTFSFKPATQASAVRLHACGFCRSSVTAHLFALLVKNRLWKATRSFRPTDIGWPTLHTRRLKVKFT